MNILLLGPKNSLIINFLESCNDSVTQVSKKINEDYVKSNNFNFLISYGYRYIIDEKVLKLFKNNAINLHISLLPYNRGSDPNFWSFIDNTPKGVSIHLIDKGIDTGDILFQKEVFFKSKNETLHTTYETLQKTIQNLLIEKWLLIKNGQYKLSKQIGFGSYHNSNDKNKYNYLLEKDGWNTKISKLNIL
tara:strand:- start:26004 stop:26573 length:570 start_codon:yes stop_codon:yes gene_type:complete